MKNTIVFKVSMCVVALLYFCSLSGDAKIKLPTIISDGMVLQRDCPIKLWGTADPNESITVQLLNHTYQTKADEKDRKSVV